VKKLLGNPWSSNIFLLVFALILLATYILSDPDDNLLFRRTAAVWVIILVFYLVIFGLWRLARRRRFPRPRHLKGERRRRPNLLRVPWVPALYFLAFLLAGFIPADVDIPGAPRDLNIFLGLFGLYLLGYLSWTYWITIRPSHWQNSSPPLPTPPA
jgi:amino acid transporter